MDSASRTTLISIQRELKLAERREIKINGLFASVTAIFNANKNSKKLSDTHRKDIQKIIQESGRLYRELYIIMAKYTLIRHWVLYGVYEGGELKVPGKLHFIHNERMLEAPELEKKPKGRPRKDGDDENSAITEEIQKNINFWAQRNALDQMDAALYSIEKRNSDLFTRVFELRTQIFKAM